LEEGGCMLFFKYMSASPAAFYSLGAGDFIPSVKLSVRWGWPLTSS